MAMTNLIRAARCRSDGGTFVEWGGLELAVFLVGDQVMVLDNSCPHASGNLSSGDVENGIVACPWHDWRFDLTTGICTHSDKARVRRYPAELREGDVWADLPG